MSDNAERRLIYLGSFEGGLPSVFEIPAEPLQRIEQKLDAEHAQRAAEAAKAKAAVLGAARNRGRLRKLMRAVFRGHRRIPQ
jgi:hypothetical protein